MPGMTGGSQAPPAPPPFNPINIWGDKGDGNKGVASRALDQDIRKYNSYYFPFPGMAAMRQAEIDDAYKQLTSPLSPEFESSFTKSALATSGANVGGGNPMSGLGIREGSFAKGAISADVTRQTLAKQDYDRARFESLMSQNPIPGLGLSEGDMLSLITYNTGAANASAMAGYANSVAGANAQYGNYMNQLNSIGSLISGLGQTYYNYNQFSGGGGGGMSFAAGGGA